MAPKRRSQVARTSANQQSTLSFHGKATKPLTKRSTESLKDGKADTKPAQDVVELHDTEVAEESIQKPTTAEKAIQQQVAEEASTLEAAPDPLASTAKGVKVTDVLGGEAKSSDQGAVGGKGTGWVGNEETQARKISDTQIKRYWRQKEEERIVPRVHQGDLTVYEKVLREFDMSGQYGPCIGIARLKRWKRANLLGLKPPIEVLAVLLKQLDDGDTKSQRAHVDELMSTRFIET